MLKKLFFYTVGLTLSAALMGATALYWLVVVSPGEEIRQENIQKILAMESPIYYRDGVHKIGVFFQEAHRQYVPFREIPEDFVRAIVAAEDSSFFEHHGIDFMGVLRALITNIRAGRVVQGGSTLTQQTAKNLFKRRDRSIRAKLKELLFAWRLEYHYPKAKILEFYTNQFYVSGNGRGLGVAARYYFDKSVSELDTLECAFIAGSVKSPGYYNPFLKKDEEAVARARELAKQRTGYVLGQMYKLGMIDPATYQRHLGREIPFKQGRMQYTLNTILDLVRDALAEPEAVEALSEHGIDNIATSGVRIVTTVEKNLQESALVAMRQELSRLSVRLRGYDRRELQANYPKLVDRGDRQPKPGAFLFGRVLAVDKELPEVTVSFDRKGEEAEVGGRIDPTGLRPLLTALVKFEKERWSVPQARDLGRLLEKLQPGDLVFVHVRQMDQLTGMPLLDLEKYPEVQGGLLAFKEGTIRAMVGGMDNKFYNRAITAKRPMGSTLKPLVYCAALQLGWNSLDVLDNRRNMFVYQNEAYFPRPDHHSPYAEISMSWAGVNSENVASVWLLYHLCDKLSPAQFKELVAYLDLARRPDESLLQYQRRIRDRHGVVVDRDALYRTAFDKAVARLEPDLIFDGRLREYELLQGFHFRADLKERQEEDDQEQEVDEQKRQEEEVRQQIASRNFIRFMQLRRDLARFQAELGADTPGEDLTNLYYNRQTRSFGYWPELPEAQQQEWSRINRRELQIFLKRATESKQEEFWSTILIEGLLSVSTLDQLDTAIQEEFEKLAALEPYSPEVLYQLREFRVLASLHYLIGLGRVLGVGSELQPVLSFPLGSNVISLLELARIYEGLLTSFTYHNGGGQEGEALCIIERIENSDGEVIFVPDRQPQRIAGPQVSLAVADILRNVVKHGTGRYAMENIRLHSSDPAKEEQLKELGLGLPVFGKTGTANRFTNATFAGYLPGLDQEGGRVVLQDGYVITAYVGYDDNSPMVRTSTHITGASGALPLWTRMANAIIRNRKYADRLDLVDFFFTGESQLGLRYPDFGQMELAVDAGNGLQLDRPVLRVGQKTPEAAVTTFGKDTGNGRMEPTRFFQPYWRMMEGR